MPSIDIDSLPAVAIGEFRSLPTVSAVYFVRNSSKDLLYIGISDNIKRRWTVNHHRKNELLTLAPDGFISWFQHDVVEELAILEEALIAEFHPQLNNSAGYVGIKMPEQFRLAKPDGRTKHPAYKIYNGMLDRCYRPICRSYKDYGARGVRVCDRWLESFWNFAEDMGDRPEGFTLERKDFNGNYCPENCCWVSKSQQGKNTRKVRLVTFNGKTQTIPDWAIELGIDYFTLKRRFKNGWSVEKALTEPVRPTCKMIEYQGETRSLKQWCEHLGISYKLTNNRIRDRGWSIEKAFTTPAGDTERAITFNGRTQSLAAWAREMNLTENALRARLDYARMPVEQALTTPMQIHKSHPKLK